LVVVSVNAWVLLWERRVVATQMKNCTNALLDSRMFRLCWGLSIGILEDEWIRMKCKVKQRCGFELLWLHVQTPMYDATGTVWYCCFNYVVRTKDTKGVFSLSFFFRFYVTKLKIDGFCYVLHDEVGHRQVDPTVPSKKSKEQCYYFRLSVILKVKLVRNARDRRCVN
jgi:hypothetical protein